MYRCRAAGRGGLGGWRETARGRGIARDKDDHPSDCPRCATCHAVGTERGGRGERTADTGALSGAAGSAAWPDGRPRGPTAVREARRGHERRARRPTARQVPASWTRKGSAAGNKEAEEITAIKTARPAARPPPVGTTAGPRPGQQEPRRQALAEGDRLRRPAPQVAATRQPACRGAASQQGTKSRNGERGSGALGAARREETGERAGSRTTTPHLCH